MAKKPLDPSVFRCTTCKAASFIEKEGTQICSECNAAYPFYQNKFTFIKVDETVVTDGLDKIKYVIKKYRKLYNLLVDIISPVYPQVSMHLRRILRQEIEGKNLLAINLGAGYSDISDSVYNVDLLPYDSVNVICDIENLPFKDNSIDYILNVAVLEHVPNAPAAIAEIYRVLKPGGKLYCFIPFMQAFHASPYDFNRYTYEGMKVQFKQFDIRKIHTIGPTSGMLWILQEWLAMVLSFGIKPLHTILHMFFMVTTFPIKFIDVLLQFHPAAKNIASGFSVECVKK
jgi:SAM-dependent methyltransferase